MTKYRQPIRPGQTGRDVKAVKLALRKLGVPGSGAMGSSKRAGPAFVKTLKTFQRHHGLKADGVYGEATHKQLAPHFTPYMVWLYRTAAKRKPQRPGVPDGTATQLAKRLLAAHARGEYRADNPGDLNDLRRTAEGQPVWSQGGYWVHIDRRPLEALVWLIEAGFAPVGTFAICSDHHYDGPHGHAGGLAVDISTVKGILVASSHAREHTLEAAQALHSKRPAALAPWQLICDGFGYQHDSAISSETIPSAAFYGAETMSQHRNHIHCGYR